MRRNHDVQLLPAGQMIIVGCTPSVRERPGTQVQAPGTTTADPNRESRA
ncbi:hypothetical protein SUDANB140_01978 [Streptomyces sp. enrichment culture]